MEDSVWWVAILTRCPIQMHNRWATRPAIVFLRMAPLETDDWEWEWEGRQREGSVISGWTVEIGGGGGEGY